MNEEYPACPKCGGHNFKVWKLPAPLLLHWVLNPGLAFNELVLGQRIPKVMLLCQDCQEPLGQRTYVPCPHCHTMNHGQTWSKKAAFGNWLGYVCPSCGERIPCLWNYTSLVILTITSPIWYLPYRFYFRDRIPRKPVPYISSGGETGSISKKRWIYMGLGWGFIMWLIMSVAPALKGMAGGQPLDWTPVVIGIPIWACCGAMFGFFTRYFLTRRPSGR
jgi:hypothetical protein